MFFVILSSCLSILVNSFSVGTGKVMYILVFSTKLFNCFSDSFTNSFIIK